MEPEASPRKTYAIVVGIEKYGAEGWDLDGPVQDAIAFTKWLIKMKVPEDNIKLFLSPLEKNEDDIKSIKLSSKTATAQNIKNGIHCVIREKEGDLFWFFWSGHGTITTHSGIKRRLFVEDCSKYTYENLDFNSLCDAMRTDVYRKFKRQIFIVDSCAKRFIDKSYGGEPKGFDFPSDGELHEGCKQFKCFASKEGEYARNEQDKNIGIFSNQLMKEFYTKDSLWPPDMVGILQSLSKKFEQMKEEGNVDQIPDIIYTSDWNDSTECFLHSSHGIERCETNTSVPLPDFKSLINGIGDRLEGKDIKKAYRQSAPPHFDTFVSTRDYVEPMVLFTEYFRALCMANEIGNELGLPPLLLFLKHLAIKVDEDTGNIIDEWINKAIHVLYKKDGSKLDQVRSDLNSFKKHNHNTLLDKGYIVIRIKPNDIVQKTYAVKGWLYMNGEIHQLPISEKTKNTRDEMRELEKEMIKEMIPERIFEFLKDAADKGFLEKDLCLEFFLPRREIILDVDQYPVARDLGAPVKIGTRCEVVVRSHDRVNGEGAMSALKHRWNSIEGDLIVMESLRNVGKSHRACWLDAKEADCFRLSVLLSDKEKLVCVLMDQEPKSCDKHDTDVLNELLNAGIPIILWTRNIPEEKKGEMKAKLKKIIEEGTHKELPERILRLRKDAILDSDNYWFGNNVTLLWDDPERLPPDEREYLLGCPPR